MRILLVLSFVLAFTGGYADAASFLLTKTFTGHLTGNTVLGMVHLAQGTWREAGRNILAVASFAAGTAAADWLPTNAGAPKEARQLRGPLAIQGLMFLAAAGCLGWGKPLYVDLGAACLCAGLGLQNGAIRKCDGISVHTTFITGISTSLLASEVQRATDQKQLDGKARHSMNVLAGILCLFASGALVGGFLSHRFREVGLVGIFVPWAVAMLLAVFAK